MARTYAFKDGGKAGWTHDCGTCDEAIRTTRDVGLDEHRRLVDEHQAAHEAERQAAAEAAAAEQPTDGDA